MITSGKACHMVACNTSPEFRLVLALCRAATGVSSDAEIESLLNAELDWDEVLRVANLHRVVPIISTHFRKIRIANSGADRVASALRVVVEESARHNLYLSKTLLEIIKSLQKAGVSALPFKGPNLASRLYGNLALRQSLDLDLLVRLPDLAATLGVLADDGFHPLYELTERQYESMLHGGECEWSLFGADGLRLDLHWNIMARYFCVPIAIDDFWKRTVRAPFAGSTIEDLAPEDLLISLALHARRHYWAKMIWILDIAQLLRQSPALDLEHTLETCRRLRSERIMLLTLQMCRQLFDSEFPARILQRIQGDRVVNSLFVWCMRNLEAGLEAEYSGLGNYFNSLRSRERWRDRVGQVMRHALTPGLPEWTGRSNAAWLDTSRHLVRMGTKAARFALGKQG